MNANVVALLYLVASVCFIQALKGLSHPTTARRGNAFGMVGMAVAIATTLAAIVQMAGAPGLTGSLAQGLALLFGGLIVGGGVGAFAANRVEMTKMPELVALMHSLIGLAAVCIAATATSGSQSNHRAWVLWRCRIPLAAFSTSAARSVRVKPR
jgi:NAD(P) transhydrogenase subunit beta